MFDFFNLLFKCIVHQWCTDEYVYKWPNNVSTMRYSKIFAQGSLVYISSSLVEKEKLRIHSKPLHSRDNEQGPKNQINTKKDKWLLPRGSCESLRALSLARAKLLVHTRCNESS